MGGGLFSQVLSDLNAEELCDLKSLGLGLPGGRSSSFVLGFKRGHGSLKKTYHVSCAP